jgi:chemotaxis protein histidine kinase CheA
VSEVSGRGVGMDVVKSNIEKLGGEIKVSSKLGQGTTFKISFPSAA